MDEGGSSAIRTQPRGTHLPSSEESEGGDSVGAVAASPSAEFLLVKNRRTTSPCAQNRVKVQVIYFLK